MKSHEFLSLHLSRPLTWHMMGIHGICVTLHQHDAVSGIADDHVDVDGTELT